MKILVTGGNGQVAFDVTMQAMRQGDNVTALGHSSLDVTDAARVNEVVRSLQPDVIVHCAAWTAVDACESDEGRAVAINAQGAGVVAAAAVSVDAHLVHLSTDYVFSGETTEPYREADPTGPINAYGRSKLASEAAVQSVAPGATIVRTSWVCGEHGPNFVKTVLRLLADGAPLRFVNDQWGCPTLAADLAPLLLGVAADRIPGIIHATNTGTVTWFDFARSIVAAAGSDPDRVHPITTDELVPARPARRPRFSALANTRLGKNGESLLPDFDPSLRRLVDRLANH